METEKIRKDAQGNIISKLSKTYHVSFKEEYPEIINVESYKQYNLLTDNIENLKEYEDNEEDEEEEEDKGQEKFDIDKYDPMKIGKMANHDPHGFSKTKCIIL